MATKTARSTETPIATPGEVLHFGLADDGTFPNNPALPLLLYLQALNLPDKNAAAEVEHLLARNRWTGSWRDGIYSYHHYHSTAHEVLAVYGGSATVQFGGPDGITQRVAVGDVVVIPAGVAHKNLGCSGDFAVVGAYPDGQDWDMCYGKAGERPRADDNIKRVAKPKTDPVYGTKGPIFDHWLGR